MMILGISSIINNGILRVGSRERKLISKKKEQAYQDIQKKYSLNLDTDLEELFNQMFQESVYYETEEMKNEDSIAYLTEQKEELDKRHNAMIERIQKLPKVHAAWNYINKANDVFANTINSVEKDIANLAKGIHGEDYVNEELKLYAEKYRILQNIVIDSHDTKGKTSEVDTYIITDKGLVVTEVKNYGNENQRLHITSDGRWVIEDIYSGRIIKRIDKTPVEQNARHCLAVEKLLNKTFGEDAIPVIPVVIIANNKVAIQNESRSDVIRVSEFYTFMSGINTGVKVNRQQQKEIEELLNSKNVGAQKFTVKDMRTAATGLEKIEAEFTKYLKCQEEINNEYTKIEGDTHINQRWIGHAISIAGLIALLIVCSFDYFTPNFEKVLLIGYVGMMYNIFGGFVALILAYLVLIF